MKIDPQTSQRAMILDAQGEVVDGGWFIQGENEGSFLPEDPSLLSEIIDRGHSIELRADEIVFQISNLHDSGLGHDHVDFDIITVVGANPE